MPQGRQMLICFILDVTTFSMAREIYGVSVMVCFYYCILQKCCKFSPFIWTIKWCVAPMFFFNLLKVVMTRVPSIEEESDPGKYITDNIVKYMSCLKPGEPLPPVKLWSSDPTCWEGGASQTLSHWEGEFIGKLTSPQFQTVVCVWFFIWLSSVWAIPINTCTTKRKIGTASKD